MEEPVAIKIKPTSEVNQQDIKKALNLGRIFVNKNNKNGSGQKVSKLWFGLTLLLFLACLGLIAKSLWLDKNTFSKLGSLTPEQAQSVIFFKISQTSQILPVLSGQAVQGDSPYQWLRGRVLDFLSKEQISLENEILPLFEDNGMAMILSSDSNQQFNWAVLLETKPTQESKIQTAGQKIEEGLRQDFGLNQLYYRQIEIHSAYSFDRPERPYYWTQAKNFIIISNDLNGLEAIIDKAMSKF